jgi:UDP-N-acetyl-D-galactosamine dehydrogenase
VKEYGIELKIDPDTASYDGIILAVAHRAFVDRGAAGIRGLGKDNHVPYDLKNVLPIDASDIRL